MISRVCRKSQHRSHFGAGDEKTILDKTVTAKAESENVIAESVSDQPLLSEKTVVEEVQEEKMTTAKFTVANAAAEEGTSQQNTHGHITTWCRCECTARGSGSSPRANVEDR